MKNFTDYIKNNYAKESCSDIANIKKHKLYEYYQEFIDNMPEPKILHYFFSDYCLNMHTEFEIVFEVSKQRDIQNFISFLIENNLDNDISIFLNELSEYYKRLLNGYDKIKNKVFRKIIKNKIDSRKYFDEDKSSYVNIYRSFYNNCILELITSKINQKEYSVKEIKEYIEKYKSRIEENLQFVKNKKNNFDISNKIKGDRKLKTKNKIIWLGTKLDLFVLFNSLETSNLIYPENINTILENQFIIYNTKTNNYEMLNKNSIKDYKSKVKTKTLQSKSDKLQDVIEMLKQSGR